MSNFYGDFTIEEARVIGKEFDVICVSNYGYDGSLTVGKKYKIKIEPRILPMSPLCSFVNDRGDIGHAHLERFKKFEEQEA